MILFLCALIGGMAARFYVACVECDRVVLAPPKLDEVQWLERCFELEE